MKQTKKARVVTMYPYIYICIDNQLVHELIDSLVNKLMNNMKHLIH